MNEPWSTIVAVALVAAGVLADLNLLRLFIGEWRNDRREEQKRFRRDRSPPGRRFLRPQSRPVRAGLCVAALPLAAVFGQSRPPEDSHIVGTGLADATQRALNEPPVTLALQPQEAEQNQRPTEVQPLTISTNRPSFNDTTGIVPIGHLQLETGYTFTFRNRDGVESQTHDAPEILVRIPLLEDRLEVQLGTAGYVWLRTDGGSGFESSAGFSDVTVGLRLKVADQDRWLPRLALQAGTTTGVGTDGISNRDAEPTFTRCRRHPAATGRSYPPNISGA